VCKTLGSLLDGCTIIYAYVEYGKPSSISLIHTLQHTRMPSVGTPRQSPWYTHYNIRIIRVWEPLGSLLGTHTKTFAYVCNTHTYVESWQMCDMCVYARAHVCVCERDSNTKREICIRVRYVSQDTHTYLKTRIRISRHAYVSEDTHTYLKTRIRI